MACGVDGDEWLHPFPVTLTLRLLDSTSTDVTATSLTGITVRVLPAFTANVTFSGLFFSAAHQTAPGVHFVVSANGTHVSAVSGVSTSFLVRAVPAMVKWYIQPASSLTALATLVGNGILLPPTTAALGISVGVFDSLGELVTMGGYSVAVAVHTYTSEPSK